MKFSKTLNAFVLTVFAFVVAGCASGSNQMGASYHWESSYADSIYDYIRQEGDLNEYINELEKYIANAYKAQASKAANKIPPGLYAHLGLLYANNGDSVRAKSNFIKEMELYPESKHYIEFLMLQGGKNSVSDKSIKDNKSEN
ncbi:DUF4810 domain-containing protein [Campylobacter sp. faydin G-140]|uniref:DUF4810 domain-containing protein n=1 Tax=Campylobacter anatolicus TaxID=2829105 RepID=UPI001B9D6805|nr:DUF4810 domain-containing protein [Campylobacter anatolicus]MBR8466437.1 DUF4810 domain-containing protein [Campylobacter anatolicus]